MTRLSITIKQKLLSSYFSPRQLFFKVTLAVKVKVQSEAITKTITGAVYPGRVQFSSHSLI